MLKHDLMRTFLDIVRFRTCTVRLLQIPLLFNKTRSSCVNFVFYIVLFKLIKTRAKPDRNGGLAEAETPKMAMKMETF